MKQRVISVSLFFIVCAVYFAQWHSLMPALNDAQIQDHFRYPIALVACFGYVFCKSKKQKWQYSLLLAAADVLQITVMLFVMHSPFVVMEMVLLPVLMVVFYQCYFDWLLSIEIIFSDIQQKLQDGTVVSEALMKQYQRFQEQRKENMHQFTNIGYFLQQEKEILMLQETLAQSAKEAE